MGFQYKGEGGITLKKVHMGVFSSHYLQLVLEGASLYHTAASLLILHIVPPHKQPPTISQNTTTTTTVPPRYIRHNSSVS